MGKSECVMRVCVCVCVYVCVCVCVCVCVYVGGCIYATKATSCQHVLAAIIYQFREVPIFAI